ncbi:MAG TPA: MFS transporter [Solirubrobacteraceae bacterium]|nr:MFS transporter [Solirubrobacteraceae bacterium]
MSPPSPTFSARRWTLIAVALATFMTYLDNNIINVAIPTIERSLHLSQSGVEWVVSAYILVFAGLLLAGGRLADVFGRKRLFMAGLAIFTGASLLAGLVGQVDLLIASRALQGLGAALVTPTTLAILSAAYTEPGERARAVGAWSAVGAVALAAGPLLGGVLSQHVDWHWIFFINVPVGIATLWLGARAIPNLAPPARRPIDTRGVSTSAAALVTLTYALIQGPQVGWTSPTILAALAAAVAAAIAFVIIERRAEDPMLDLSLFANRTFTGATVALMLWAFGLFGIYFFTSLYLQQVLGVSATTAGAAFVPMAVLMAFGAAVSDRVAIRFGAHRTVGAAMGLMGAGIVSISLLGAHATFGDLMPSMAIIGIGGGLTIPLTATILDSMPSDRAGVASGVFNASREVAGLLGITVIGVILRARETAELHAGHPAVTAFLGGYRLGLVVAGLLVASGGGAAWFALRELPSARRQIDELTPVAIAQIPHPA